MSVAIDPGVRFCGECVFHGGEIVSARLTEPRFADVEFGEVLIEFPRVYPAARQKGDQNDLLQLARVVGNLEARAVEAGGKVRLVYPRDWKGTLDGDTFIEERIKPSVTEIERGRIYLPNAKSLHHNVWDAVGLALWAMGRLQPRRVYPR